ncbi:MAG: hypothetical protein HYR56_10570 [Acidobacteria bacterium]|nr:hypothetical protein [Acidobacteriota bacterium]MBI3425717.1 hypothetical protein [Acidobacteriota bacterium]
MNVSAIATTAISQAFDRFNTAAAKVAGAADPENPADTVDLADAVIELSSAKLAAAAGVRVFRAEQELVKNTLDILA